MWLSGNLFLINVMLSVIWRQFYELTKQLICCKVPRVRFEQVKNAFIKTLNQLSVNYDFIVKLIEKGCKNFIILEDLNNLISEKKVEVDSLFADLKEMVLE